MLTTASDMLFSGARDGSFFALDARTGKLLWQTNLGPSVAAGPMTYAVNGKQYGSMRGGGLFTWMCGGGARWPAGVGGGAGVFSGEPKGARPKSPPPRVCSTRQPTVRGSR